MEKKVREMWLCKGGLTATGKNADQKKKHARVNLEKPSPKGQSKVMEEIAEPQAARALASTVAWTNQKAGKATPRHSSTNAHGERA